MPKNCSVYLCMSERQNGKERDVKNGDDFNVKGVTVEV